MTQTAQKVKLKPSQTMLAIFRRMRRKTSSLLCPVTGEELHLEYNKQYATKLHDLADGYMLRYMGHIYITAKLTAHSNTNDVNVYTEDGRHVGTMWNEIHFEKIEL